MSGPVETTRGLRRDAAVNLGKILDAARQSFDEEGFDVGIDVIAQRAGVGVGTVYRRFPNKDLLIQTVVDEVLVAICGAAALAMEHDSAADGLNDFLFTVGQLLFNHAGCLPRLWKISDEALPAQIEALSRELLLRAQRAGAIRDDVVYEDVITVFWSLQGVIERTATIAPNAWKRHLELMLQSLMFCEVPLVNAPITPQQAILAKRVSVAEDPPNTQ